MTKFCDQEGAKCCSTLLLSRHHFTLCCLCELVTYTETYFFITVIIMHNVCSNNDIINRTGKMQGLYFEEQSAIFCSVLLMHVSIMINSSTAQSCLFITCYHVVKVTHT